MELFNNQQIPFGFNFKWNSHYFFCEIENFGECAGNIEPLEAREKYRNFLDNLDK